MIQMRTMLTVADNSGAKKLQAIRQLGGSNAGQYAGLGDIIVCTVKEAAPESQVKKGTVVKAVIVRTRRIHLAEISYSPTTTQRVGERTEGARRDPRHRPGGPELRERRFMKIVSPRWKSCRRRRWRRAEDQEGRSVQVMVCKTRATGKVLGDYLSAVVVEHVNMIKRHSKPNPGKGVTGGIVEREAPVSIANVMVISPDTGRPSRIGFKRLEDGRRVRVAKVDGAILDQ